MTTLLCSIALTNHSNCLQNYLLEFSTKRHFLIFFTILSLIIWYHFSKFFSVAFHLCFNFLHSLYFWYSLSAQFVYVAQIQIEFTNHKQTRAHRDDLWTKQLYKVWYPRPRWISMTNARDERCDENTRTVVSLDVCKINIAWINIKETVWRLNWARKLFRG